MLDLVDVPGGTLLRLRVKPRARADAVLGEHGGALKVSVTAVPERGKANRAVLALLARELDIAPSSLDIVSGQSSQNKTVRVPLSPETVHERLQSLLVAARAQAAPRRRLE